MNKETMTVHKALAELKILDARIFNATSGKTFVASKKVSDKKIGGVLVETLKKDMKSDYQSVTDLIARRTAIKRAVVLSNAKTPVVIGGEPYTVAEAIEMKSHGIMAKKDLLDVMVRQYERARAEVSKHEGEWIEAKAEQYIMNFLQCQPKEAKTTKDSEVVKRLREEYIANNTYELVDPLDIGNEIKVLSDWIDTFTADVDSQLSVSNATTTITVEY
jgi:hypothetical protein